MKESVERLYERTLILRCQAGDGPAFAELVARHGPRLGYYLRKLTGTPDAAEDFLQDVWLAIYRALPRLADPAAFVAWAYRIARDRAFRERRGTRLNSRPLTEADIPAADGDCDFTPDEVEAVHAALDELAPAFREVLVLRFLEDMTYDEIARVTGCPLGTVQSRLHHAKRALRAVLTRETRP